MLKQLSRLALITTILLGLLLTTDLARAAINQWTSQGPYGGYVLVLAIDPATPQTLYAGTGSGVYKSTDGGGHWNAANTGLTNTDVCALAIDPTTPQTLYAGTDGGVFKSTDRGGIGPTPA